MYLHQNKLTRTSVVILVTGESEGAVVQVSLMRGVGRASCWQSGCSIGYFGCIEYQVSPLRQSCIKRLLVAVFTVMMSETLTLLTEMDVDFPKSFYFHYLHRPSE
jgi:hypothetical protein